MKLVYDKLQFYRFKRKEKREIIDKARTILAEENRILVAVVFGSLTKRNTVRDIDLGVYSVPTLSFNDLLDLNGEIERDLGFPVDLVELTHLSPDFRLKVLRNGILVKGERTMLYRLAEQAFSELMSLKNKARK